MLNNKSEIIVALEVISAKAKQLAQDIANNKLWEGEFEEAVALLYSQLSRLKNVQ